MTDLDWFNARYLVAGLNLVLCSIIGAIAICRIALMSKDTTRITVRMAYCAITAAASVSGWSPLLFRTWPGFGEWPGIPDLVMAASMLIYMGADKRAWKFGLPSFAKSDNAPLDEDAPKRRASDFSTAKGASR